MTNFNLEHLEDKHHFQNSIEKIIKVQKARRVVKCGKYSCTSPCSLGAVIPVNIVLFHPRQRRLVKES